jgi:hypothetical protein
VAAAFGQIEGHRVEAFEYLYSGSDNDGNTVQYDQLLVAVEHPWVQGDASFRPEQREWSTVAAALDALLWIPPFTFLKAIQLLNESRNPDRVVGHAEFDRLYVVHAASDEAARRAIPTPLRDLAVRIGFRGTVELRAGLLLFAPQLPRFDASSIVQTLGIAAALVGAFAAPASHPMR